MASLLRPVIGVLAALTLATGFAGVPHAAVPQVDALAPADVASPPVGERDSEISRDDTRPAALPEVTRALNDRREALSKTSVEIGAAERSLQVNDFVQARDKAEKAVRYAEKVEQLGYDPRTTDPRDIAKQMMLSDYKWGEDQFTCLNKIFTQESNWRWNAKNPSSGAYGIPQSLPATKMASAGDDWQTNPATQIKWGLKYIKDRYGTPCSAWGFKSGTGWY